MRLPILLLAATSISLMSCGDCDTCPEIPGTSIDDDGDGYTEDQGDCDDADATIFPHAEEICGDEVDQDCSGDPDDGLLDADDDGYLDPACTGGDDCDDGDAAINPGVEDGCDGEDNDCDGYIDEDALVIDAAGGGDYTSIQAAVDDARAGDSLCVLPGVYQENVVFDGGEVQLVALEGPELTTIDGGGGGSVLVFQYGDASTVSGFTLTGGSGSLFDPDNDGNLDACGGGVFADASDPVMVDVVITGNTADDGGGVYVNNGTLLLTDSLVSANTGNGYGGGMRLRHASDVVLDGTEVSANTAQTGAGFSLYDSELTLIDATVSSNEALSNGGGFYAGSDSIVEITSGSVRDNIAAGLGGGIRAYSARVLVAGAEVTANVATEGGGGVACKSADLSLTANIHDNSPDDVLCDECTGCTDSP
ncbi:MAG: putative metal-binding motif-containing protein [Pseudomonadota bacterium]